jgi:hypothetical protein
VLIARSFAQPRTCRSHNCQPAETIRPARRRDTPPDRLFWSVQESFR